jgi:tyrosine-protein phosphatase YwqE
VWNFFKSNKDAHPLFKTDLHSHLLPGLDDGVKSFEESEQVILSFQELGFSRAITTPHIMSDYYRNTAEGIKQKGKELNAYIKSRNISFDIEVAAEYYFDETLLDLVNSKNEILEFGDKYILFETNSFSEPAMLDDLVFQLKVKNYKPVMAHPERYQYLQSNFARIEDLIDRGVYMQVNALSFLGFYSRPIQKVAQQLVDKKMVHFLGSDCHNPNHAKLLKKCLSNKYFNKALELPLLNHSL